MKSDIGNGKRRRGRPPVPGIDDSEPLSRVARLLVAKPSCKPWTAIKQVLATDKETPVRRLYRKWKLQGTPLIAREQDRLNHEKAKTVAASNFLDNIYLIQNSRAATKFMKAAQDFSESPMAIALEKAANSPLMRAITEFANSPLMKVIAESANSPGMIAAKQLASSARVQSVLEAGMQIKNLLELENNKSLWAKNLSETEQSLQALQGA